MIIFCHITLLQYGLNVLFLRNCKFSHALVHVHPLNFYLQYLLCFFQIFYLKAPLEVFLDSSDVTDVGQK